MIRFTKTIESADRLKFIVNFSISFLFLIQDIGKAFRQLSSAAVTTSASPSLDKIGVCYEEMAGMVEAQAAKVELSSN